MDIDTVCSKLADCSARADRAGQEECLRFMKEHFAELARSKRTHDLSKEFLTTLITADDLRSDEITVLEVCIDWARHHLSSRPSGEISSNQCSAYLVPDEEEARLLRDELGDVIYRVRLPLLNLDEFARIAGGSALLSADEKKSLLDYITSRGAQRSLKFDCSRRTAARSMPLFTENVIERFSGIPVAPSVNTAESSGNGLQANGPRSPKSPTTKSPLVNTPPVYPLPVNPASAPAPFTVDAPVEPKSRIDSIEFVSTRDVRLTGLGLYPAALTGESLNDGDKFMEGSKDKNVSKNAALQKILSVIIEVYEEGSGPGHSSRKLTRQYASYGPPTNKNNNVKDNHDSPSAAPVRVTLREPLSIRAGVKYSVVMQSTGPVAYIGCMGKADVTVDLLTTANGKVIGGGGGECEKVKFTFTKSKRDFNGTDVNSGQFPQLFFSLTS